MKAFMQIQGRKMIGRNLFTDETRLFEALLSVEELGIGFKAVKANRGSPGIDGMTIEEFGSHLNEELGRLIEELENWTYEPKPVRRVEIPKATGGVRLLGVPCVRDRVVQATIKNLLEPIFDPKFSDSSYGFRPGKNQKQAVERAREIVASGKGYVVDIDLSKFFDRINHDRLINRLSKTVPDKRLLRLIGMTLRSGVMVNGVVIATTEGSVQGSPLSPLLSNVVLDELDQELGNRGLEFCRFADDCNIFAKTHKAADRIMSNVTRFIEKRLKLQVNQEKSQVAKADRVKFLGMTVIGNAIAISKKSMKKARAMVAELTPRGTHETLEATIKKINQWYGGWSGYYQMTYFPAQLGSIEAHIRRRLRARLVSQQKSRHNLAKKLIKRHVPERLVNRTVFKNDARWALSHTRAVEMGFSNHWFTGVMKLATKSTKNLSHWFGIKVWPNLA
ncbi:MAG: RNA-directed DNA polymerase (Reverse transcriptase) [Magnetococcales bacterium]|nr:RNA-directed DNA polymerase (Reverse transcriptase) [Magnetococcales bacterium]